MIAKSAKALCFLLILLLVAACGQSEANPIIEEPAAVDTAADQVVAEVVATDTAEPVEETAAAPTNTPELTPTAEAAPTLEPEPGTCLDCHSDKEQLIDTAAPVEEAESSESSGVG